MNPADDGIARKAAQNDIEAFDQIAGTASEPVYRICLTLLKNKAAAEDAAQDILIKAYRAMPSFKGDASVSTWIYRIAYNHCLDALRKENRRRHESLDALLENGREPQALRPQSEQDNIDNHIMVRLALETLPEDSRIILTLREVAGLSYKEIAQALEISEGTVKSRLSRAKEALCAAIEKLCPPEPAPAAEEYPVAA